jgi:hypothetical protein
MTRTKRVITVGLASAALAAATLLPAAPAHAAYNEGACRAALEEFRFWRAVDQVYQTLLIPRSWAVTRTLELAGEDVMAAC